MPAIRIYTTNYCGYCMRAKSLLKSKGIAFKEIDVTEDDDKRRWLADVTGYRTVPQIFIGERPIGGYTQLAELESSGELDRLLKQA